MKIRLDQLLLEKGIFESREKARTAIMTGKVMVNQQVMTKPGTMVDPGAEIVNHAEPQPFVSRGGFKLKKALEQFQIYLEGKLVLDVGASTGGFTDCALQHGAKQVLAVDVGYGQLAWVLRQDPRVRLFERTNIRYLDRQELGAVPQIAVIDVSFISLSLVLPKVCELLAPEGSIIALIKPQFEAGREKVGKKGVVKDPQAQREAIIKVIDSARRLGLSCRGLTYSPLLGPEGNIEYLVYLSRDTKGEDPDGQVYSENIVMMTEKTVAEAHQKLLERNRH